MRVGLTGATGLVGWPIQGALRNAGHEVVTLGRSGADVDWRLGEVPDAAPPDVLVHAAFSHAPGKYRGGEGEDPEGFLRLNRDGSLRLVDWAPRVVFLSSRAVYGDYPAGTVLREEMTPRPDTLYGEMKAEVEAAVAADGGTSLRATGVYGPLVPGRGHKWENLFEAFARGEPAAPRVGTEVAADDLAAAVLMVLDRGPKVLNVSDLMLDRRDLLAAWGEVSGIRGPLPERADLGGVSEMATGRLRSLGWSPGGRGALLAALERMAV